MPQFEPEQPQERELRRRIVEEAHDDRIVNDGHPDADGARTIAEAVTEALTPNLR